MPVFTFTGKNTAGETVSGERVSENKQVLKAALSRERIRGSLPALEVCAHGAEDE